MGIKALLLNPPGDRKYLRDYFCSTISKTGYYWQPIDLLVQSGFLSRHFDVSVIDAIALNKSGEETYKNILLLSPNIILSLTSVLSIQQDMEFLKSIKQALPDCLMFAAGEPFLEQPQAVLKTHAFLNGALLDFIYDDITAYIEQRYEDIKSMVFRKDDEIIIRRSLIRSGSLSLPISRHGLFPLKYYRMPLTAHHPFASVLTAYGCPYACTYCNSGANTIGFLIRNTDEVIREILYIKRLGIKHIFIKDMTFGASRRHALEISEEIIRNKLNITWHCYSRADTVDDEMLGLMKRAGCSLIQFGVETSNEDTLSRYKKDISTERTIKAFELAQRHGILTGAHFIFGLPGDTTEDMNKTLQLVKRLRPAYVSFNIAVPRYGTPLKYMLVKHDDINTYKPSPQIKKFVNRAYISFYIRPAYIFYILTHIKTTAQFYSLIREGIGMLFSVFTKRTSDE